MLVSALPGTGPLWTQLGVGGGQPGLTEDPGPPAIWKNRVLISGGREGSGLETGSQHEGTAAGTVLRASW